MSFIILIYKYHLFKEFWNVKTDIASVDPKAKENAT